jgi:hypothetical protein
LAGRGADLFLIDDPHSEQDVKANSRLAFDTAWSWFQTGPLQRLMPNGAIIVVMTRWGPLDLTGRLIDYQKKNPDSPSWEIEEMATEQHYAGDPAWLVEKALGSINPKVKHRLLPDPKRPWAAVVARRGPVPLSACAPAPPTPTRGAAQAP